MQKLLTEWRQFLKEARGDNYKKLLDLLTSKNYDLVERPPSVLIIKTANREETKSELENELLALNFSFNDNAPGSGFGRFELYDKENGNVYIYFKPVARGAAGAGADYEEQVANTMSELLPNMTVSTAGFGAGSDLTITDGSTELKMELKTSSGADFGQFKLAFDLSSNTWRPVKTKKFIESEDLFLGLFNSVLNPQLDGKVITNPDDPVYNVKNGAIFGLLRSPTTGEKKLILQSMLFDKRKDLIVPVDPTLIRKYYAKKGDSLIIVQGKGVYALTEEAKKHFDVPLMDEMITKANLRFRIKPHMGTNGVHSFTVALKLGLKKSATKMTDQKFLEDITSFFKS